jgi:hypothetical protein
MSTGRPRTSAQPKRGAASTTRIGVPGGPVSAARRLAGWRENSVVDGMETTLIRMPCRASPVRALSTS